MLTALDGELFSKDCEVVHVPSHDLRIYLIQKNATSSLRDEAKIQNWPIFRNQELIRFDHVDVYLRDPESRCISGINTFIQHLVRDNPRLDLATCESLATKFCFLNRHYLPQWHWLVNLARFISPGCMIRLHALEDLEHVTGRRNRAGVRPLTDPDKHRLRAMLGDIDLWLLLDKILLGRIGQSLSWSQLLDLYKDHPSKPLDIICEPFFSIADVLR